MSENIEDYYFTPWDLGYGHYVKFDHDFVGREALEQMAPREHRQKVTLALDDDDVTRTIGTMFQETGRAKFMDWPAAVYSMHQFDDVTGRRRDGRHLDLDRVQLERGEDADPRRARRRARRAPGTEVTLVWGEEDGGTAKPTVEPHVQTEIRAIVAPALRRGRADVYAPGSWRAAHA